MSAPGNPPQPEILKSLLPEIESGFIRAGLSKDQVDAILPAVSDNLLETARAEPSAEAGGPKVVWKGHFLGLKDAGGKVIEGAVKLAIAAIVAGHGHIDGNQAKEAVVDTLVGLRSTVMKLDDGQKLTCAAILEITRRKRSRVFIEPGASAAEIQQYFVDRNEIAPPKLDEILAQLSRQTPKVLESATFGNAGPFYQVRF